jgi:hypothetical protein
LAGNQHLHTLCAYTSAWRASTSTALCQYAATENSVGSAEAIAEQLLKGVNVAGSEPVGARLEEMADFYRLARYELEGALQKWRAQR